MKKGKVNTDILREGEGKAFVRKFKKSTPQEATMVLLMIKGDIPLFDNGTMHVVDVVPDGVDSVRLRLLGKKKADDLAGYRIDQILLKM